MNRPKFTLERMVEVVDITSRARYGSKAQIGDIVRLIRYDPEDDTWKVEFADQRNGEGAQFWIAQEDLKDGQEEEELDSQARQLFGIDPHCPTCKRPY